MVLKKQDWKITCASYPPWEGSRCGERRPDAWRPYRGTSISWQGRCSLCCLQSPSTARATPTMKQRRFYYGNRIPQTACNVQHFHVERPSLQMKAGEDAARSATGEQFESALRVGNAAHTRQHHHEEVEAVHQHIPVPRSLYMNLCDGNDLSNRILLDVVPRSHSHVVAAIQRLLQLLDFGEGRGSVRICHENIAAPT